MRSKKKERSRAARAASRRPGEKRKGSPQPAAPMRRGTGRHFEALVALQSRLRAPNGCPWDREQTHDSLRTYLVEETYEVLDALDSGDPQKLAGELGDLLLQIVFHAELAAEAGQFDMRDVIEHIHAKMVRRHPHVFGKVKARTSAQVLKNWEQLKAGERAEQRGRQDRGRTEAQSASVLDGVPATLPGLLEAHQLTRRAANVGFDWQHVEGLLAKLSEEAGELQRALALSGAARREEEIGDLLFVCVNLARFLGLDAEIALKKANRKFSARFREMERVAASHGKELDQFSPDELEALWNDVKAAAAKAASSH